MNYKTKNRLYKIRSYSFNASWIFLFLVSVTVIQSLQMLTGEYYETWVRFTTFAHLIIAGILFFIWSFKKLSWYETYKAPMFLSISSFIYALPTMMIKNDEIISEGYGDLEYDNRGAHVEGEPTIATHMLDFDPYSVIFIGFIIASLIFIILWKEFKEELRSSLIGN